MNTVMPFFSTVSKQYKVASSNATRHLLTNGFNLSLPQFHIIIVFDQCIHFVVFISIVCILDRRVFIAHDALAARQP